MMASPLLNVGPGKELESGVFPSVDPISAPFWSSGQNVNFRKGGVQTSKGFEKLATLSGNIHELAQAFNEGEKRIYGSVDNYVYMYSTLTGQSLLGSFAAVGNMDFETFGTWLLATNGINPVRLWKNTGTLDEIVGDPSTIPFSRAALLHRKDNHVLAFNTDLGGNHYAWCSASDVEDWVATNENSAGANWIRDLDSEIVAVKDIGDFVAVYSRETMGLISYVGQPNVFAHKFALNGVGAAGPDSVVSVGPVNFGLNLQGIFQTDGVSFAYLDEPAVHELVENANFNRGNFITGYHNEKLASVIWFYDSLDGARLGIGYNYKKQVFETYAMEIAAAMEKQIFDTPIGAVGSDLVYLGQGHNAGTAALVKWARTKPLSAGDSGVWKNWSHLKLAGQWNGATVKFGAMEDPTDQDSIEWFSEQNLAFEVWIDRNTPFLVMEFRAEGLGEYFNISQIQLFGEKGALVSL